MDVAVRRTEAAARVPARAIAQVALCLAVMFAGSTIPTPLYPQYQLQFGFSELTLTLIYAAYVLGNLCALLIVGRLSDQVGRRPVLLAAAALAFVSALVYLSARGTGWLAAGRIISGIALGTASGTCTAWLAELHPAQARPRATLIAVSANMAGLGFGALCAGVLAQYAPWPLHLSFIAYAALLIPLALIALASPETVQARTRSLAQLSLQPRVGVPGEIRTQFVAPAITVFGTMALFGFYAALAPSILRDDLGQPSRALSGAVVAQLCVIAAVAVPLTRRLQCRAAMLSGLALMLPSVALLLTAQYFASLPVLLLGTMVAGVAAALGYRGSLQVINQIAPAQRRAEVVSSYLLAGFVGNSIPIIGVGILTRLAGALAASATFAATIALFAVAALTVAWRAPR